MPLPAPQARSQLHTRAVVYRGYKRDDGLWDIEAELSDTKTYGFHFSERGDMPPGSPIHGMAIRVTVDDNLKIQHIETAMDYTPYAECQQGNDPMQQMVGATMGPGWRQAIEKALGGVRGCTHLRELLFNMATAAYQTIPVYRTHMRKEAGLPEKFPVDATTGAERPPYHVGKCLAWDFNGNVVKRNYPQFVNWQPLKRVG